MADGNVERQLRSLTRTRAVCFALALLVPLLFFGAFNRQARRLEALGREGRVATAVVTGTGSFTQYAYALDEVEYTWSAARAEAPFAIGERFDIVVLPSDPALSRPGSDPAVGTREAAANRRFTWKVMALPAWLFGFSGVMAHLGLRRIRTTGRTESADPGAYRNRLALTAVLLAPLLAGVLGWHALDAVAQDQSLWPVFAGGALSLAIVVGTGWFVLREGPAQAAARSRRLIRWVAPLGLAVAAVRVLLWLVLG